MLKVWITAKYFSVEKTYSHLQPLAHTPTHAQACTLKHAIGMKLDIMLWTLQHVIKLMNNIRFVVLLCIVIYEKISTSNKLRTQLISSEYV